MVQRARDFFQTQVLDRFHWVRGFVLNVAVWLAIRLAAYELTFTNVKKRTSPHRTHADLNLDSPGDLDGLLTHAKAQVTDANARRVVVTDKCKTLLTFNTALIALIAVFQAKATDLRAWEIVVFSFAVAAFVVSLLVLWTYFDVGGELASPLDQELVGLSKENLKKHLINSNLRCASEFENRTDFLVDLYRTSRFYLMFGFALLLVVVWHSYWGRAWSVGKDPEPMKIIVVNKVNN